MLKKSKFSIFGIGHTNELVLHLIRTLETYYQQMSVLFPSRVFGKIQYDIEASIK